MVSGQLKARQLYVPGKIPRTHWIKDCVGPKAGLDDSGLTQSIIFASSE
jgi:hypothetical protein